MKYKLTFTGILSIIFLMLLVSCKKKEDAEIRFGSIHFSFSHHVDDQVLIRDTMLYMNAADNRYMVTELQYFISDVILYRLNKEPVHISLDSGIHYIDTDIPSTWEWAVNDVIPIDKYDSISFIFGLDENTNKDLLFTDPPESLMFWPDQLGGGFHYMKLNGKWLDNNNQVNPFNFHLGIGQTYDTLGKVTGYVQNYFRVNLPNSSFLMTDKTMNINIVMDINRWFNSPNVWDFNSWGGSIMQNEDAMRTACENGRNVFEIGSISEDPE